MLCAALMILEVVVARGEDAALYADIDESA